MEKEFDKYKYYMKSVQSTDADVDFFENTYKELKGEAAESFREDFCGTYILSQEWVKRKSSYKAIGVDLDPEPISYGDQLAEKALSEEQKKRLTILNQNVMDENLPQADIVSASNFSYFIFKKRQQLLDYFKKACDGVKDGGIFVVDIFGGSQCYEPNEEETEHKGFSYYWDQDSWDPVTNFAQFYIHFKLKGEKKRKKCFSYDWRLWSIPEVRELMIEAGFTNTHVYWEGTDKDGEGDGVFKRVKQGEDCESWIAYIVAEK